MVHYYCYLAASTRTHLSLQVIPNNDCGVTLNESGNMEMLSFHSKQETSKSPAEWTVSLCESQKYHHPWEEMQPKVIVENLNQGRSIAEEMHNYYSENEIENYWGEYRGEYLGDACKNHDSIHPHT